MESVSWFTKRANRREEIISIQQYLVAYVRNTEKETRTTDGLHSCVLYKLIAAVL